jgi:uncharacterized protein (DUF2147 family)
MTPGKTDLEGSLMKFMPTLPAALALAATLFAASSVFAASPDPTGDWRVADGTATVRIKHCGAALCGYIAGTSTTPGRDDRNPDPKLRGRSVMGIEVLINMQKAGENVWAGTSYNAEDGQTYATQISVVNEQALQIQGCSPGGGACGSETWARVK